MLFIRLAQILRSERFYGSLKQRRLFHVAIFLFLINLLNPTTISLAILNLPGSTIFTRESPVKDNYYSLIKLNYQDTVPAYSSLFYLEVLSSQEILLISLAQKENRRIEWKVVWLSYSKIRVTVNYWGNFAILVIRQTEMKYFLLKPMKPDHYVYKRVYWENTWKTRAGSNHRHHPKCAIYQFFPLGLYYLSTEERTAGLIWACSSLPIS